MTETTATGAALLPALRTLFGTITTVPGPNGRATIWVDLPGPASLAATARALKDIGARLSVITAFTRDATGASPLAYTFDIEGNTLTLKFRVRPDEAVETIVPLFRNADWLEREIMELFDVRVSGRPHNRRLFLDESVDGQVMDRLIPLSVLANSASTTMLFERIAETGMKE